MKRILLIAFAFIGIQSFAQLKFTYVNPTTQELSIKNFGSTDVDITNYRLCALFEYANIAMANVTIVSGDLILSSGESVSIHWTASTGFGAGQSDMGLYLPSGGFNDPASMVDFMEYGAAGQGRENVAASAGLWTAGTFLTGSGPWYYTGNGSASGLGQWSDQMPSGVYTGVRINEIDADQPGTDALEFIELYGEPNASLDGLTFVLISGAPSNLSYAAYDLDGYSLDENGFFVLGSAGVANLDYTVTVPIQNGADAVAIYIGDATSWPNGTVASPDNIVDAAVYGGPDDAVDTDLLDILTPGQPQLVEENNSEFSMSRVPDGGIAQDVSNYVIQLPTPGVSNLPSCFGGALEVASGSLVQCAGGAEAISVAYLNIIGDAYLYILTDASDNIVSTNTDGLFATSELPLGEYHIWGLAYTGNLNEATIAAGLPATGITGDACVSLTAQSLTLSLSTCEFCDGGEVSVPGYNSYISVCLDENPDEISFTNLNTGNADFYSYVITGADSSVVLLVAGTSFDFNALTAGSYRVFGLSYFGNLDLATVEAGDALSGISSDGACLDVSGNYVEVYVAECNVPEGCTRLFISEYLEGSGNNKAIEIYNPSPFPVDLDHYDLFAYANGNTDFTSVVALEGTLQPNDVYIIANSQAGPEILALADITSGLATFNGDDALVLTYDLEPIDVIGVVGEIPVGGSWNFGSGSTENRTLVRKPEITSPTTDWSMSQGQWLVYEVNDLTQIGSHAAIACSGEAFVSFEVTSIQVEEDAGSVEVTVNAYNVSGDVPITVGITASTAVEGDDFTSSLPVTLTFSPGVLTQSFTIDIIDDLEEEDAFEYIELTLNDDADLATFVNQTFTLSIAPSDQSYPFYPIADLVNENAGGLADSLGVFCTISGIVHGINFNPAGIEVTLIEGAGGIKIFDANESFGYSPAEGDSILVSGQVSQFNGMTVFFPDQITLVDGGHPLEIPTVVTSIGESNESHMVSIRCVELVDPSQWTQTGNGFDVELTDGSNTFIMHVDLNTDIYSQSAPEGHFTVVGIGAQNDADSPYDSGYEFWPRYLEDYSNQVLASFTMPSELIYDNDGAVVDFVNTSEGASTYSWDFGDGAVSDQEIVSHTYSYDFLSELAELTVNLVVSDGEGCNDSTSQTVDVVLSGILETSNELFSVYPNPTSDVIFIHSFIQAQTIRVLDAAGRIVISYSPNASGILSLDLSSLETGVYTFELQGNGRVYHRQVVKQ